MIRCRKHNQTLAPTGMPLFLKRGRENETCDRLNIERLSNNEKENMSQGIMTYRHFIYKDYCQNIFLTYDSIPPNDNS